MGLQTYAENNDMDIYSARKRSRKASKASKNGTSVTMTEDMKQPNEELGYIAGVIMGDASIYKQSDGSKKIVLQATDKDFVSYFGKIFCNWCNLNWNGLDDDNTELTYNIRKAQTENSNKSHQVIKSIASIYEFLNQYQEGQFKVDNMLDNPKEFKIGLLRGLWDSEGSINKSNGRVAFTTTDDKIGRLYMKLVEHLIGVDLDLNGTWTTSSKASKKKGEFTVTKRSKWGARNIYISNNYTEKFYNVVNPTIERKRKLFEGYMNKDTKNQPNVYQNNLDEDSNLQKYMN